MKKIYIFILIVLIILLVLLLRINFQQIKSWVFVSQPPNEEDTGIEQDQAQEKDIEIVADNLDIPWEIAFLPSGEMLITERPGNLVKVSADRKVIPVQGVKHIGEGGLQGLAIDPDFANNNYIYLYLTTETELGLINRVERYRLENDQLLDQIILIDDIPGARYHDGGRIKFGPDGKLYITTGDATQADRAQDLDYLGGKILRINSDGTFPSNNPFESNPVYSYGHRNPQGLTWDEEGNLWATEHGRSGVRSGLDELNKIEAGQNYGWPIIEGDQIRSNMKAPLKHSGTDYTWAPAGAVYLRNSIFFAGLRGEAIYEFEIDTEKINTHFFQDFGRLRALVIGPDEFLYVSTSNTDGRGTPKENDDKIIKINPQVFD